jgi:hypothetical protein
MVPPVQPAVLVHCVQKLKLAVPCRQMGLAGVQPGAVPPSVEAMQVRQAE